jgi:D-aminopeptidase
MMPAMDEQLRRLSGWCCLLVLAFALGAGDAAIFIGYHAKAGSPGGLFAHTGSTTRLLQVPP